MTRHKFLECDWKNGFATRNAILETTPYHPEVLILGTFNPAVDSNKADFFYGRNYFWRILENLTNPEAKLNGNRIVRNGKIMEPALQRIFEICKMMKLSFADLVMETTEPVQGLSDRELNMMGRKKELSSSDENIVAYLNKTPSIRFVYATTKFTGMGYLLGLFEHIKNSVKHDVRFGSIVTPSAQGGHPNVLGLNRAATKTQYWLWANHPEHPGPRCDGYEHLDHEWLRRSGVEIVGLK